jgi:hypothetical protein
MEQLGLIVPKNRPLVNHETTKHCPSFLSHFPGFFCKKRARKLSSRANGGNIALCDSATLAPFENYYHSHRCCENSSCPIPLKVIWQTDQREGGN